MAMVGVDNGYYILKGLVSSISVIDTTISLILIDSKGRKFTVYLLSCSAYDLIKLLSADLFKQK